LPEKFQQITGRPESLPQNLPAEEKLPLDPNLRVAQISIPTDLRSAPGATVPLKEIAAARGLNWEKVWETKTVEKSIQYTAAEEAKAWGAFDASLATGAQPTDTTDLKNFVSNSMRSAALKASISNNKALVPALDNNAKGIATKITDIVKWYTGSGVNPCHFDNTCNAAGAGTGTVNPPVDPPVVNPDNGVGTAEQFNTYKTTALTQARNSLDSAGKAMGKAEGDFKALSALKAKPGREEEMGKHKEAGRVALGKIKDAHAKIEKLVKDMEACTNKSCIEAVKEKIKEQEGIIAAAQGDLSSALASARAISTTGGGASQPEQGAALAQLKQEAQTAYGRVVTAYNNGNASMTGFPAGTAAKDEKKRQAQGKMNTLKGVYNAAGPYKTAAANASTEKQATTARDELRKKANSAENLAKEIAALRKAAGAQPAAQVTDKCHENAKGCKKVTAFYVTLNWTLKPQKSQFGAANYQAYTAVRASAGTALHSSVKVQEMCKKAWAIPNWLALVDSGITENGGITKCTNEWFSREYRVNYDSSGNVITEGDNTRVISTDPAEIGDNLEYRGAESSDYDMSLKVSCSMENKAWRVKAGSLLIKKPSSKTETFGANLSVGPSVAKIGGSYAVGTMTVVPFGQYKLVPGMAGAFCYGGKEVR
jgi:hypothetical protein